MHKKYYLKNAALGFLLFIITLILVRDANLNFSRQTIFIFILINGILFPFAKFSIEKFALRFTSESFWKTGFFEDDTGMQGIKAIYITFCYLFAIPLSVFYFIDKIKKSRKTSGLTNYLNPNLALISFIKESLINEPTSAMIIA